MPQLVITCTWGIERAETLMQAFTIGASGVAAGAEVSVWLMGEAAWHAVAATDDVTLDFSPPLSVLRAAIMTSGTLSVCAQCAARRGITQDDLVPGARIAGAVALVEATLAPDARALVF